MLSRQNNLRKAERRIRVITEISVLSLFLVSCATTPPVWRYSTDVYSDRQPLLSKKLYVPPFRDSRPDHNVDFSYMFLIPLMPYGWVDYSRPDELLASSTRSQSLMINPAKFDLPKDLAKAAAEELNASGLFNEVVYSDATIESDFVLRGELKSSRYQRKEISYGLSFIPYPWPPELLVLGTLYILGLPAGTLYNELSVDFVLQETQTDSSIWKKSYKLEYRKSPYWIYNVPLKHLQYDNLFKNMMRDVVKSLESELSAR